MDRNEKQNSFRNTRRTRGESKSIQKLKRRLRLTTVFAVVMLAAFLGSLAWLKISNDASQKTIDEQRREIANKDEEISRMEKEKQDVGMKGAESTFAPTSEPEADPTPEPTVAAESGSEADPTPEPTVAAESGSEVDPTPNRTIDPTGEPAVDYEDEAADNSATVKEDTDENKADTEEASADGKETSDVEATSEQDAGNDTQGTVHTDENDQSEDINENSNGNPPTAVNGEEYQSNNKPELPEIVEMLNQGYFTKYQLAIDEYSPGELENKRICQKTGGTSGQDELENVESEYLQNLLLIGAYEKRLYELHAKEGLDLRDIFTIPEEKKDFELVISILGRYGTADESGTLEKEEAVDSLLSRIGFSHVSGPVSYSADSRGSYIAEGNSYIRSFLTDVRYFGNAACKNESEAQNYYGEGSRLFNINLGMSLLEHLTHGYNKRENDLWNNVDEQGEPRDGFLLDGRLKADYIDKDKVGTLSSTMKDKCSDKSVPFFWIEDTQKDENGVVLHSYVYMLFPCDDGNHWCVSALFIDGGELNEEQADRYCDYLLELAETPANTETGQSNIPTNGGTTPTPLPADGQNSAGLYNTNSTNAQ